MSRQLLQQQASPSHQNSALEQFLRSIDPPDSLNSQGFISNAPENQADIRNIFSTPSRTPTRHFPHINDVAHLAPFTVHQQQRNQQQLQSIPYSIQQLIHLLQQYAQNSPEPLSHPLNTFSTNSHRSSDLPISFVQEPQFITIPNPNYVGAHSLQSVLRQISPRLQTNTQKVAVSPFQFRKHEMASRVAIHTVTQTVFIPMSNNGNEDLDEKRVQTFEITPMIPTFSDANNPFPTQGFSRRIDQPSKNNINNENEKLGANEMVSNNKLPIKFERTSENIASLSNNLTDNEKSKIHNDSKDKLETITQIDTDAGEGESMLFTEHSILTRDNMIDQIDSTTPETYIADDQSLDIIEPKITELKNNQIDSSGFPNQLDSDINQMTTVPTSEIEYESTTVMSLNSENVFDSGALLASDQPTEESITARSNINQDDHLDDTLTSENEATTVSNSIVDSDLNGFEAITENVFDYSDYIYDTKFHSEDLDAIRVTGPELSANESEMLFQEGRKRIETQNEPIFLSPNDDTITNVSQSKSPIIIRQTVRKIPLNSNTELNLVKSHPHLSVENNQIQSDNNTENFLIASHTFPTFTITINPRTGRIFKRSTTSPPPPSGDIVLKRVRSDGSKNNIASRGIHVRRRGLFTMFNEKQTPKNENEENVQIPIGRSSPAFTEVTLTKEVTNTDEISPALLRRKALLEKLRSQRAKSVDTANTKFHKMRTLSANKPSDNLIATVSSTQSPNKENAIEIVTAIEITEFTTSNPTSEESRPKKVKTLEEQIRILLGKNATQEKVRRRILAPRRPIQISNEENKSLGLNLINNMQLHSTARETQLETNSRDSIASKPLRFSKFRDQLNNRPTEQRPRIGTLASRLIDRKLNENTVGVISKIPKTTIRPTTERNQIKFKQTRFGGFRWTTLSTERSTELPKTITETQKKLTINIADNENSKPSITNSRVSKATENINDGTETTTLFSFVDESVTESLQLQENTESTVFTPVIDSLNEQTEHSTESTTTANEGNDFIQNTPLSTTDNNNELNSSILEILFLNSGVPVITESTDVTETPDSSQASNSDDIEIQVGVTTKTDAFDLEADQPTELPNILGESQLPFNDSIDNFTERVTSQQTDFERNFLNTDLENTDVITPRKIPLSQTSNIIDMEKNNPNIFDIMMENLTVSSIFENNSDTKKIIEIIPGGITLEKFTPAVNQPQLHGQPTLSVVPGVAVKNFAGEISLRTNGFRPTFLQGFNIISNDSRSNQSIVEDPMIPQFTKSVELEVTATRGSSISNTDIPDIEESTVSSISDKLNDTISISLEIGKSLLDNKSLQQELTKGQFSLLVQESLLREMMNNRSQTTKNVKEDINRRNFDVPIIMNMPKIINVISTNDNNFSEFPDTFKTSNITMSNDQFEQTTVSVTPFTDQIALQEINDAFIDNGTSDDFKMESVLGLKNSEPLFSFTEEKFNVHTLLDNDTNIETTNEDTMITISEEPHTFHELFSVINDVTTATSVDKVQEDFVSPLNKNTSVTPVISVEIAPEQIVSVNIAGRETPSTFSSLDNPPETNPNSENKFSPTTEDYFSYDYFYPDYEYEEAITTTTSTPTSMKTTSTTATQIPTVTAITTVETPEVQNTDNFSFIDGFIRNVKLDSVLNSESVGNDEHGHHQVNVPWSGNGNIIVMTEFENATDNFNEVTAFHLNDESEVTSLSNSSDNVKIQLNSNLFDGNREKESIQEVPDDLISTLKTDSTTDKTVTETEITSEQIDSVNIALTETPSKSSSLDISNTENKFSPTTGDYFSYDYFYPDYEYEEAITTTTTTPTSMKTTSTTATLIPTVSAIPIVETPDVQTTENFSFIDGFIRHVNIDSVSIFDNEQDQTTVSGFHDETIITENKFDKLNNNFKEETTDHSIGETDHVKIQLKNHNFNDDTQKEITRSSDRSPPIQSDTLQVINFKNNEDVGTAVTTSQDESIGDNNELNIKFIENSQANDANSLVLSSSISRNQFGTHASHTPVSHRQLIPKSVESILASKPIQPLNNRSISDSSINLSPLPNKILRITSLKLLTPPTHHNLNPVPFPRRLVPIPIQNNANIIINKIQESFTEMSVNSPEPIVAESVNDRPTSNVPEISPITGANHFTLVEISPGQLSTFETISKTTVPHTISTSIENIISVDINTKIINDSKPQAQNQSAILINNIGDTPETNINNSLLKSEETSTTERISTHLSTINDTLHDLSTDELLLLGLLADIVEVPENITILNNGEDTNQELQSAKESSTAEHSNSDSHSISILNASNVLQEIKLSNKDNPAILQTKSELQENSVGDGSFQNENSFQPEFSSFPPPLQQFPIMPSITTPSPTIFRVIPGRRKSKINDSTRNRSNQQFGFSGNFPFHVFDSLSSNNPVRGRSVTPSENSKSPTSPKFTFSQVFNPPAAINKANNREIIQDTVSFLGKSVLRGDVQPNTVQKSLAQRSIANSTIHMDLLQSKNVPNHQLKSSNHNTKIVSMKTKSGSLFFVPEEQVQQVVNNGLGVRLIMPKERKRQ